MDADAGNAAIRDGSMQKTIETLMERLQPESAYFYADSGMRSAQFVFDMTDTDRIPVISEPLFMTLKAKVEYLPVMNADDLQRGLSGLTGL